MNLYKYLPINVQEYLISLEGKKRKAQRFLNDRFIRWATFLNDSSRWSSERLEDYRRNRLKEYLLDAYVNSDFWHQEMQKVCKENPEDAIREDPEAFLKGLPIIDKKTVLANKEAFINKSQKDRDYIMVHTSGTTGAGLRFPWSLEAVAAEFAFIWFRRYHGVYFGDKYGMFNGNKIVPFSQQKPPFWRHNRAMNQTLFSIFHLRKDLLKFYVDELNSGKYAFLAGYPSAIYEIANYMVHNGIYGNIGYVFPSSETLYDWQKEIIGKAFNARVYDSYTNAEQSVLIYQCEEGYYHLAYEYSYTEIEPVETTNYGYIGKIIGTNFLNNSIYLIRYDTGDYVEVDNKISCPCGRAGSFIKRIIGREDDVIYTYDGRAVGRLDHLFKDAEDLEAAQIIQEDFGNLTIRYILRGNKFMSKAKIEKEIYDRLGPNTKINFEKVDNIEREKSGKIRGVISKIKVTGR